MLDSSYLQFWPSFLSLCSSHVPKTSEIHSMFHSRNGVPFIIGLVDSSNNETYIVVAEKYNFGVITSNGLLSSDPFCATNHEWERSYCVIIHIH